MYNWDTNIRYVKKVGPASAQRLNDVGINTVGDLLEHLPLHHVYPGITPIKDLKEGHAIIKATVKSIDRLPRQIPTIKAVLNDGTGTCTATWWNQAFVVQNLHPGMVVTFWGRYKAGQFQQPKFTTCEVDTDDIVGGYYGINNRIMRNALKEVFSNCKLPNMVEGVSKLGTFQQLHNPKSKDEYKEALKLLKFDELLLMQLAVAKKRKERTEFKSASMINCDLKIDSTISHYFPYKFTKEQNRAINEIVDDIKHTLPMNRLLHGDVGCGKTAVAFYAAMLTALNNKHTLILCPTTILAQQHYDTLKGMGWDDVELYAGKGSMREYKAKIIVCTHAILYWKRMIKSASLVIIDEFQKFGVEQRAKIQQYGTHLLLMSATPIPRTLAMSIFGDLDVSIIKKYPIERGHVITRWVHPDKRNPMYDIVEGKLRKGKQVYVVYPRIESEDEDIESAAKGFEQVHAHFKRPGIDLGFLTGQMSNKEKTRTMNRFREGDIQILISTVIAEVGLDNPNASVMIVEGADRFGLSQLHQLRGRICRSTDTTFCFLMAKTANEKSIARLEVMEKCNDGFEIAEQDLRLRGPGDMFSIRQHGLPDLKFASLLDDFDILVEARDKASELVDKLDEPENIGLKQMLELKYGDSLQLGEVI